MREDRIVSRSKDGHRYKKKKTVPVLVPIIAAGIIAVTSFNVGAYCERHDIHFFEKKAEQSQPEVQVEELIDGRRTDDVDGEDAEVDKDEPEQHPVEPCTLRL